MPSQRFRRRSAVLLALAIALGGLHFYFPLPYVYRVLVLQDSDSSDTCRFPATSIAASDSPTELPGGSDPRLAEVLEQHPDITELSTFLEQTETTAFLVVHQGGLVEERYLRGHGGKSFQNTFSVSKSITSALVGLAARDGLLELDAPIGG